MDENKNQLWARTLSEAYFPLSAECNNPSEFEGTLNSWSLGILGLSEMECDGVLYHRKPTHFANEKDSSLLITIPHKGDVNFKQASRETRCGPGSFLVERGDMPYEFWHGKRNKLWVLKVPTASVRARLGPIDRLGALTFDSTSGVGAYFMGAWPGGVDYATAIGAALADCAADALHWSSFDWTNNRDENSEMPMAKAIKQASGKPMLVNGGIADGPGAEAVFEAGAGEAAVVGRPLFAQPDWPHIIRSGMEYPWAEFDRKYVIQPPVDLDICYPMDRSITDWDPDLSKRR